MKQGTAADIINGLLILLFSYTAISKILTVEQFRNVLRQMPLTRPGADVLAWTVPLTELAIVLLLIFSLTRLAGMYASLVLLSLFTVYLLYMVLFALHLPCRCGGVISSMNWKEHVVFNLIYIGLTVAGIRKLRMLDP